MRCVATLFDPDSPDSDRLHVCHIMRRRRSFALIVRHHSSLSDRRAALLKQTLLLVAQVAHAPIVELLLLVWRKLSAFVEGARYLDVRDYARVLPTYALRLTTWLLHTVSIVSQLGAAYILSVAALRLLRKDAQHGLGIVSWHTVPNTERFAPLG